MDGADGQGQKAAPGARVRRVGTGRYSIKVRGHGTREGDAAEGVGEVEREQAIELTVEQMRLLKRIMDFLVAMRWLGMLTVWVAGIAVAVAGGIAAVAKAAEYIKGH